MGSRLATERSAEHSSGRSRTRGDPAGETRDTSCLSVTRRDSFQAESAVLPSSHLTSLSKFAELTSSNGLDSFISLYVNVVEICIFSFYSMLFKRVMVYVLQILFPNMLYL